MQVPPPASHGASATATFYKALENGVPHNGRRVKIDYSSSGNPTDKRRNGSNNDGTRDIGSAQTPVLLFRGLDPLSGPGAISQAMKTSAGPGKDGAKGMKRIILIRDKITMASWGFAFVEFVDIAVRLFVVYLFVCLIYPFSSPPRLSWDTLCLLIYTQTGSAFLIAPLLLRSLTQIPSSLCPITLSGMKRA